jgi:mono/diheme cytochrome c family protein
MTPRPASALRLLLVAPLVILAACRGAAVPPPSDPLLDAIRAEERVGGLSYGEGQGKHLFGQYCATCHGDEGHGDGQNASNLNPPPPDLTTSKNARDAAYQRRVIAQGSAAAGRSPLSPPWGRSLSPQQIEYLVAYCQALTRPKK